MRIFSRVCGLLAVAGICALTAGCADDNPKPGGVTTVSPGIPEKSTGDKPADKPDDMADEKPKPPADAGSTTGGGTETPAAPKDGE